MELLLPPRPFRAAPSSPGSSFLFCAAMRAMVQDRRARQGPAPDPTPCILDKRVYASTFSSGVGACWWIPAGGEVLLCYSLCRGSRFLGSGRVPRCLESVHFFHGMLAQGPAGGRRLALRHHPDSVVVRLHAVALRCFQGTLSLVAPGFWDLCVSWARAPLCGSSCRLWSGPVCFVSRSSSGSFWEFRAAAMVQ